MNNRFQFWYCVSLFIGVCSALGAIFSMANNFELDRIHHLLQDLKVENTVSASPSTAHTVEIHCSKGGCWFSTNHVNLPTPRDSIKFVVRD